MSIPSTDSVDPLLNEIFEIINTSTFCVNVDRIATKIYLQCFKDLIGRYLNDNSNYIYLSVSDTLLSLYQSMWPIHQRLFYTNYDFIPSELPIISNRTYIYIYHHPQKKQTIENQLLLSNFSASHTNIKYVYVGKLNKLSPATIIKMFRYYFYFNKRASRWGRDHLPIINDSVRTLRRKYYTILQKKKKKYNKMTIYDYFIFCDLVFQTKKIYNFNKKTLIKKNKTKKQKPVLDISNGTNPTQIQYIYTDMQSNTQHLIMPDGKKEKFSKIIEHYSNLIEI